MSQNLSRRELLVRGAVGGAALAVPFPDALAAVRRRTPRESVHCLPAGDRFRPREVIGESAFAAFAPDGRHLALETPHGIEILSRDGGGRTTVTPPGFTLSGSAWHPAGGALIASGPAADDGVPHLHLVTLAGMTRLLPDHPDSARAACFSPDGKKVAFTYTNRFQHQLCLADWTGSELADPRNLLPVDPATEANFDRLLFGLAYYETRGFSADGRRLYFASDRGTGMLNVSVHYMDLKTGRRRRVSYDEGVAEGAVIAPDDQVLYTSTTRAREPGFLTLVSGPMLPPFLGFVATPTLHDQLARRRLAPIGNGDLFALDPLHGLHGRMVGKGRTFAKRLNGGVPDGGYRLTACSMSPDGTELAAAMVSAAGTNVILYRRSARSVPTPAVIEPTPSPPGSQALGTAPRRSVDRIVASPHGGSVRLRLTGDLSAGQFSMELDEFSQDGVHVFAGPASFNTAFGGFRHAADVRRLGLESQEEVSVFYTADMRVAWLDSGGRPVTAGSLSSRSRSGNVAAAWDGNRFAPLGRWTAGDRTPRPVPGARRCPRERRT
ncbi:MAG TPA: hypothetical protein VD790_12925 [Thermoleophilaceae bacterium]|nr:hypothetical protein [Thermoleophilaceae bacterium]